MILKIINQAGEILFEHNGRELSDEVEGKITSFNNRTVESILIIANEGLKMKDAHSVDQMADIDGVKEFIMKLKD